MYFKMDVLSTTGMEIMARTNLAKLRIQVVRCMKLIDKYERRIDQMKVRQDVTRNVMMTLRAQIETKEAMTNALPSDGTQTGA